MFEKLEALLKTNGMRDVKEWETYLEKLSKYINFELPLWYKVFMLIDFKEPQNIYEYEKGEFFDGYIYDFKDVFSEYENHEDDDEEEDQLTFLIKNAYVPVSDDAGGGDYFAIDFKGDRVLLMYHDELHGFEVANESIESFIKTLKDS